MAYKERTIIASEGGAPTNPDWYHNIKANPTVTVELGREQFQARAIVAEGAERDRLCKEMVEVMPGFAEYQ
jgi:deazaflavin-dependent oxidoreductase (nitroreductase family)